MSGDKATVLRTVATEILVEETELGYSSMSIRTTAPPILTGSC